MSPTVCSERLMLVSAWPLPAAKAETREVLPTPGSPSSINGRLTCMARRRRKRFDAGPGAVRQYEEVGTSKGPEKNKQKKHTHTEHVTSLSHRYTDSPLFMKKGGMPNLSSAWTSSVTAASPRLDRSCKTLSQNSVSSLQSPGRTLSPQPRASTKTV